MTDNDVIRLFLAELNTQMTALGHTVPILQSYQPTKQGAATAPAMYFYKIGDRRLGSPRRLSEWDALSGAMIDYDTQLMETTFQLSALVRQPDTLTASDILNDAAMVMQSEQFIKTLKAGGVGILRVGEIRNPYFGDDRDQFQAMPSFDFIVSYNRTVNRSSKVITTFVTAIDLV